MSGTTPRLALVPGEPAGIGPELCVRLAQTDAAEALVAIADGDVLAQAARRLGLPLQLRDETEPPGGRGTLALRHRPLATPAVPGRLDARNARATIDALLEAGGCALRGEFGGMVTGPVHKGVVNDAGIAYTGTTELLAQQAGVEVVMMLASDVPGANAGGARPLRVGLATTHLPLRAVADAITARGLERTLRILHAALRRDFGLNPPRIAVLGLNPHAGEAGHLGYEEIEVIIPVLEALRAEGLHLDGPLPADTAFLPAKLAQVDAVLAMYHDQGLPVLKHAGFERAVNITLGLPYVRVAVDHGTALELAGRGVADPSSLILAARMAGELAQRRAGSS